MVPVKKEIKTAEQEMRSQAQVEHPDQEHVDQRPDRYDVPHDGRDTGSDTEKAQTTRFKKLIELTKRRIVERFLTLSLRFEKGETRVHGCRPVDLPRIDALALKRPASSMVERVYSLIRAFNSARSGSG